MKRNAIIGGAVWIAVVAESRLHSGRLNIIQILFLLGPLVVVPLGLELCVRLTSEREIGLPIRIIQMAQLAGALFAAASFWFQPGITAAALAFPWICFSCLIGIRGLLKLFRGEWKNLKMACLVASFLYLPIGSAWLVASRFGLTPMGFQEPIVLLTAVHFHFAGFAAPLLALAAGSTIEKGRFTLQRIFQIVAPGVLIGPGLLAAGFVIGPSSKLAAALLVGCAEIGLSILFLAELRSIRSPLARAFLAISAASVLFAMAFAGAWAIGEFPLQPFVHLDEMARFHGTANAFGFVLCGLVGWTISARPSRAGDQE
jgi:YndJ-like protein